MSNSLLPLLTDHDATLAATLSTLQARDLFNRRAALRKIAGIAGAGFALSPLASSAACAVIPSETAGPYPGDGTNGPNVLTQSGVLRSDIRSSFGSAGTAAATGTPLTIKLQIVNTNANCAPLANYAVYLWHADAGGNYSMYSSSVSSQNYLRGVQVTDSNGYVTFTTIFPGCYDGRWPHMHFEIYDSVGNAVSGRNAVKTSQLALPETTCKEVYSANTSTYPTSTANLSRVTLASDNVFRDDQATTQLATMAGSLAAGYTGTLQVGVAGSATAATNLKSVEFYNSTLKHYVILTAATEIAAVESGSAGAGWSRTGATFDFEPMPGSNSTVVHRFYGSMSPGPNSHFYTISATEKDFLVALAAKTAATEKRWNYEPSNGFWAGTATNGACDKTNGVALYTIPIYRLYNNGFAKGIDSNHRYTSSMTVAASMQTQGWTLEGVAFCALSATTPS